MPLQFGIAKHPTTHEKVLVCAPQAEPFERSEVIKLLRILKEAFPTEFREVQYEIVAANGSPAIKQG